MRRLLLALLVGLNLTLVCQGHHDDEHPTGPHLALLGEVQDVPPAAHEAIGRAAAASQWIDACTPTTDTAQSRGHLPPSSVEASTLAEAYGKSPEISDLSTLGCLILERDITHPRLHVIASAQPQVPTSQSIRGPEPPPPRANSVRFPNTLLVITYLRNSAFSKENMIL